MRAEIKELQQRLATTMVYVTHDQIEAMTMADRIVVLRGGVIEQIGTPLDLYDNPANTFVATFIGTPSMNLLAGTISGRNPETFVTTDGTPLPLGENKAHLAGKKLLLGVRPESFELGGDIPLQVRLVEPTGGESIVFGRIGGQDVVCSFPERLHQRPDTVLKVRIKAQRAHFFNAETTIRET
jgi:multiple sugar transport system ATP-binding protein